MTWFRLYHDLIDDPKIQLLPIELRWRWIEALCISSRSPDSERGSLPDLEHVAFHMKLSVSEAREVIDQLIGAGLIDKTQGSKKLSIHGWDKRQYKSDNVTSRWHKHKANVDANTIQTSKSKGRAGLRSRSDLISISVSEEGGPGGNQSPDVDPELTRVAEKASALSGNATWASWVVNQAKIGHPPFAIDYVIEKCAAGGEFNMRLAAGILRSMKAKGDDYAEARPRPDANGQVPYRSEAKSHGHIPGP